MRNPRVGSRNPRNINILSVPRTRSSSRGREIKEEGGIVMNSCGLACVSCLWSHHELGPLLLTYNNDVCVVFLSEFCKTKFKVLLLLHKKGC